MLSAATMSLLTMVASASWLFDFCDDIQWPLIRYHQRQLSSSLMITLVVTNYLRTLVNKSPLIRRIYDNTDVITNRNLLATTPMSSLIGICSDNILSSLTGTNQLIGFYQQQHNIVINKFLHFFLDFFFNFNFIFT